MNDYVDEDYKKSREIYYDLLEKGTKSLKQMMDVAHESEHPRAYEVLSGMIKNLADVSDKLMDLNKKTKDIKTPNNPGNQQLPPGQNTTNNIFVGSTSELQKLITSQKEFKDIVEAEIINDDSNQSDNPE